MKNNNSAFTLLEIAVVLSLLGVIAVFAIGISNSVKNMTKMTETKKRMELVAEKMRDYYRGHEDLPDPSLSPSNSIPVESTILDMEQKYRMDAWGKYFEYHRLNNPLSIRMDGPGGPFGFKMLNIGAQSRTLITGLTVDGKTAAGILISGGPNQSIEPGTMASPIYSTVGDDILVPIDVSQEAVEIALENLNYLQQIVHSFDAVYSGIDNNGATGVDEDLAVEQGRDSSGGSNPDSWPICPPVSDNDPNAVDPDIGTLTLDHIKANRYPNACQIITSKSWGAVTTGWTVANPETRQDCARGFIFSMYALAQSAMIDPWLNGYVWGCGDVVCTIDYTASDPHYHKFFSAGPDGIVDTSDDIIP